jgi:hypothetical protein
MAFNSFPSSRKDAGGLVGFYGDGSDGVLDLSATPAQQITTPNGGTVANFTDGGYFNFSVTNSISSGAVVFSVDFGQDVAISSFMLRNATVSTGTATLKLQSSVDGMTWGDVGSNTLTTTLADYSYSGFSLLERYWRFILTSGSGITVSIGESEVSFVTSGTVLYPVVAHSGLVLKNYKSIKIPSGFTLTCNFQCRGMVLYSQGDVNIVGTLTMSGNAGFGTDNIAPMIIGKLKSDLSTKALTKYYQLTTVLDGLKGGAGGNGGNGGVGPSTNGIGGTGGNGRINAGGYGGGGGGASGGASNYYGGNGGSIAYAELGGGAGAVVGIVGVTSSGCNGGGGSTGQTVGSGGNPAGSGGGGGAQGGAGANSTAYAGGLVLIICRGTITNSGIISANGGSGAVGGGSSTNPSGTGGGGGGAGGGVVGLFYGGFYTNTGSVAVNGGAGGAAGIATGGAVAGTAGSSGSVGTIVTQKLTA